MYRPTRPACSIITITLCQNIIGQLYYSVVWVGIYSFQVLLHRNSHNTTVWSALVNLPSRNSVFLSRKLWLYLWGTAGGEEPIARSIKLTVTLFDDIIFVQRKVSSWRAKNALLFWCRRFKICVVSTWTWKPRWLASTDGADVIASRNAKVAACNIAECEICLCNSM